MMGGVSMGEIIAGVDLSVSRSRVVARATRGARGRWVRRSAALHAAHRVYTLRAALRLALRWLD